MLSRFEFSRTRQNTTCVCVRPCTDCTRLRYIYRRSPVLAAFFSQRNSTRSSFRPCTSSVAALTRVAPPFPRDTRGHHTPRHWPAAAASRRRRRFAPPLVSALSQDPYRDGRDPAFCTVTGFDRRRLLAVPCISTLLTLRLLSDSGRPPLGCYPIWPPPVTMTRTRDGRSLSRDAPPFLMMTADSSRSPRLLLLLTVR